MNFRFKVFKDVVNYVIEGFLIVDRFIYEDWYFVKINYDLERMNDLEFFIYKELLDNMMEEI